MSKKKKSEPDETEPVVHRIICAFSSRFNSDLAWWYRNKKDEKKTFRILEMVTAVMQDPFDGIGKPEPLKHMNDTWSRRIDQEHRLLYRVRSTQIDFLACRYHYEE